MPSIVPPAPARDVIVAGGGVVGLTAALALARSGAHVTVLGAHRPGEASPAAAGMLAPGLERTAAHGGSASDAFAIAARDGYPAYLAGLREYSDIRVPLNDRGILEIVLDTAPAITHRDTLAGTRNAPSSPAAEWLDSSAVAALEPALTAPRGAILFPRDGAVETGPLLRALEAAVRAHPGIRRAEGLVRAVEFAAGSCTCTTMANARYRAGHVVLAAGAWTPQIEGLPRPLPIEPIRGQILALRRAHRPAGSGQTLGHVVYGRGGYLVPRETGEILVGSTMEAAGFDPATTGPAQEQLHAVAVALCPILAHATIADQWAGLRPVTPDLLPILGPDPDQPSLLYACGHSRNGILLSPLTGECLAALVAEETPPVDISPFSVTRFEAV